MKIAQKRWYNNLINKEKEENAYENVVSLVWGI